MLEPSLQFISGLMVVGVAIRLAFPLFLVGVMIFSKTKLVENYPDFGTKFKIVFLPTSFTKKLVREEHQPLLKKLRVQQLVGIGLILLNLAYWNGLSFYLDAVHENLVRCQAEKNCDYHNKMKPCKAKGDVACR